MSDKTTTENKYSDFLPIVWSVPVTPRKEQAQRNAWEKHDSPNKNCMLDYLFWVLFSLIILKSSVSERIRKLRDGHIKTYQVLYFLLFVLNTGQLMQHISWFSSKNTTHFNDRKEKMMHRELFKHSSFCLATTCLHG